MKYPVRFPHLLACLLLMAACFSFTSITNKNQASINGAWQLNTGNEDHVIIFADGYLAHSAFNKSTKSFLVARGGTYRVQNGSIQVKWEYDTEDKEKVGQLQDFKYTLDNKGLVVVVDNDDVQFTRMDNGTGDLSGNWRISGRMVDGKKSAMNTQSARKTLKILSGTRFQWLAINPETKEFLGTGGGSYTFKNGKYTETIEFFPRDSSRIGMSLTFDDKIVNGEWHHTGLSSKGDKLYEIWSRVPNK